MAKTAKEKKITGKNRGPYKSYKDPDGEKELSSAIAKFHRAVCIFILLEILYKNISQDRRH